MQNDDYFEFNGIKIKRDKTMLLLKKIIMKEAINLNDKAFSDSAMVKQIKDLLEEEVKCYSNL